MTESAASQNPPQGVPESFDVAERNLTLNGNARVRRAADLVYFVQAAQLRLIKIGVAGDLPNRMRNLRTGCPDELIVLGVIRPAGLARPLEQAIHAQFWPHRHHGEWFKPAPALLAYIAENAMDAAEDDDRQHWEAACAVIGAISGEKMDNRAYPGDDEPEPPTAPVAAIEPAPVRLAPKPTKPPRLSDRRALLASYKAARGIA